MTTLRMRSILQGPFSALIIAVALATLMMLIAGVNPVTGFAAMLTGALGGRAPLAETLVQTAALLFPALGICIAFRAGLFNIGAEGQLIIGGLFAGALGAHLGMTGVIAIPVVLLAGAIGGGLWGSIAGFLRARFGANEIIVTLMLNFIGLLLATYLVGGPLKSASAAGSETAPLPVNAWLPVILPETRLTIAVLIALALAFTLRWILRRTIFGFELTATGDSPEAARRSGINMRRITILAMTLSGAIAGIGGAAIVSGTLHRFNTELSPGYGYTAIAVALVADLDPVWIAVAAFGFAILENGGLAMQALADVPKDAVKVIEGLIIVVLAARRYIATQTEHTQR